MKRKRRGVLGQYSAALAAIVMLGSCGPLIPPGAPGERPPPAIAPAPTALLAGIAAGPSLASLGVESVKTSAALGSFRESCPQLLRRTDASGLTRPEDWRPACDAAATWPAGDARSFFATWFETVRVGEGESFVTGYYEPEIAG